MPCIGQDCIAATALPFSFVGLCLRLGGGIFILGRVLLWLFLLGRVLLGLFLLGCVLLGEGPSILGRSFYGRGFCHLLVLVFVCGRERERWGLALALASGDVVGV